jgi:ATP-dependent Clp protease adaptor protein ClpS
MCGPPRLYGMISILRGDDPANGRLDYVHRNVGRARSVPYILTTAVRTLPSIRTKRPETRMSDIEKRGDDEQSTGVVVKTKPRTRKPSLYKVLMLNDDYTPMEFVVHVLERFFAKNRDEATRIMMHVHRRGVGICGVYTYEVAETKVTQVMDFARQHQHPLQCTLEKE